MIAEVISIGDELTSGQRVDTNSAWISRELSDLGVRVLYHTTVADDLIACTHAFEQAMARADVVISTGGLGPTADDLTREAIANAASSPLELDAAALAHIEGLFALRGREMPPANKVQAMFPRGSTVIPNPHGTAPGIDLPGRSGKVGRGRVFALPGVPAEMKEMWPASIVPALRALGAGAKTTQHFRLKCFGIGESDLERKLPDLIQRGRHPSVGITVHQATITLRVTATGDSPDECRNLMQPTLNTIQACLGDLVFGEEDDELQHVVARMLDGREQTLATVEVGTLGTVGRWMRELPNTSCYRGGVSGSQESVCQALSLPQDAETNKLAEAVQRRFFRRLWLGRRIASG